MNASKTMLLSFLSGFLYVFGLTKTPTENIRTELDNATDSQKIAADWNKIGLDIWKSYEQLETTSKTN